MVKITGIEQGSIAEKFNIKKGDLLLSINGNGITDVLDYRFYLTDRLVTLELEGEGGKYAVTIKKDEYDDIGLEFETPLMDSKQSCRNGCIFCFIDQNPKGLRDSLYFKDDDSRLSFLHGNYVTLTNMTDSDIARIIKMRISPINISIHTTNPDLRVKMMKNKRAGDVLRYLDDFLSAGLSMCGQIVLCRGVNDGEELRRSLTDLSRYYPALSSVAVVPAGLTKHREGLYPLSDFTPDEAGEVIDIINSFGEEMLKKYGTRVFYAADEFYLKASCPLPPTEYYEDFPQIENGVGMLRSFSDEFNMAEGDVEYMAGMDKQRKVTVVTGVASYPMIKQFADRAEAINPKLKVNTVCIINKFFGQSVTVSGLLTGIDILEGLRGIDLGDELLLPENCLRHGDDLFLCGMTAKELSDSLGGIAIRRVGSDGYEFFEALFGVEN